MWTEYGLLEKVSEISGDLFNQFSNWTQYDNNTAIFYETWTVYSTSNLSDPSAIMYFGRSALKNTLDKFKTIIYLTF